jgi:cobalt/nickel transport system permease protein
MTHQWHDTYRHHKTPAHHLDPRSKLLTGLFFVLTVLCTPTVTRRQAAGYGLLIILCAALARLSWRALIGRFATLLPFVAMSLFSMRYSNLSTAAAEQMLAKSLLSIAAMSVVALTTPFPDLLRALEQCRLPKALVLFLAFLYRYAAVLGKETLRLERGWTARYFGRLWIKQWTQLGHAIAMLLVRSYERAERVYAAMLARGFSHQSGWAQVLHFGWEDALFAGVSLTAMICIRWGPLR